MPTTIGYTPAVPDGATAGGLQNTVHRGGQSIYATSLTQASSPLNRTQFNVRQQWLTFERIWAFLMPGKAEKVSGLTLAVNPLFYTKSDGTRAYFAGNNAFACTDNTTGLCIWIDAAGNALAQGAAFPVDITTFHPVCKLDTSSGAIVDQSIVDVSSYSAARIPSTASSVTGTTATSFTLDNDNAGAGATQQVRFNRGSDDAEDAATEWDEANDRFNFLKQHSTPTLAPVNASALMVGGTDVIAADGDLAAASIATDQLYVFGANGDPANGLKLTPAGGAGAPSAGAHTAGELAVDSAGKVYVCVANGTPGTWQLIGKQDDTVVLSISNGTAASAGNPSDVTIQAQDQFGNNIAAALLLRILLMDDADGAAYAANVTAFSVTTGTLTRTITANKEYIIKTNGSGQAVIRITNSIADDVYVLADVAPGSRPMDCRDVGQGTWT